MNKQYSKILGLITLAFTSCVLETMDRDNPANYELYISISANQGADVSPDGTLIAYYHQCLEYPEPEDYPAGLYIMGINGDNPRLLLKGLHRTPSWSPDGKWLVFTSNGTLQIINLEGDSIRTFEEGINDVPLFFPDWSPNGKSIIFSSPILNGGFFVSNPLFQDTIQILDVAELHGAYPNW